MLEIIVESRELYDEETSQFIQIDRTVLQLEHSLISISKWESKWHKPFISSSENLSTEEIIDYIKCMTVYPTKVADSVYLGLSRDNTIKIMDYIKDPMTASWVSDRNTQEKRREIITSELIYYWMIALNIPFECQKWHLNRLLMLVKVCNTKNNEQDPKKNNKMSKADLMSRNRALNAQRKAKYNTRG